MRTSAKPLADSARERLRELGYRNVEVRCGDAYHGWPEHAPFDLIIAAAAPGHVPERLVEQLAVGGRFVLPGSTAGYISRFFPHLPLGDNT